MYIVHTGRSDKKDNRLHMHTTHTHTLTNEHIAYLYHLLVCIVAYVCVYLGVINLLLMR